MIIPETTSAENLARYIGSKILATGKGSAWRDFQVWGRLVEQVSCSAAVDYN